MSFFTGFATGFANRASEINRERDRQRNRNLEQAMERFSNTIERRREELRTLNQQRQQARILAASIPGMPAADAEAFVFGGQFDAAMRGQFTPAQGAAPTPTPGTAATPTAPAIPAPTPAGGAGGGLASPPQAPNVPQATPQAAQAPQPPQGGAAPSAPVADPREEAARPAGPIQRLMFGRNPFEGVEEEVRQRYMRESGMTREQMDRLLAPPQEPRDIAGRYQYNQFTPQQEAQMAQLFLNREGYERARNSGWRDLSGLATMEDAARLQAMIRAAGAYRPPNITSAFNAALRAAGSVLPSIGNGLLRQHIDPATGNVSVQVAVPSNDPRYAQAVRAQMAFMGALGAALRGEIDGVASMDPGQALNHALRMARMVPGIGGQAGGAQTPSSQPQRPSLAEARRGVTPAAPNAPLQPTMPSEIPAQQAPRFMERNGVRYENTGRMEGGRIVWRSSVTGREGTFND